MRTPSVEREPVPDNLFNYTSGRWLWNESWQLSIRRRVFDWRELMRVAASAAGSHSCVKFSKLSEGQFNKVFLLTMDDGKEIVAKIPNPNAGYDHYVTASEVATMDYVRNTLGLPVPKVYAWESRQSNPVGAEYILMEKAPGTELSKVWDDMTDLQKAAVVQKLADIETAFASAKIHRYGSLYYSSDLTTVEPDSAIRANNEKEFVIGPTTDRNYFDHGRWDSETSRGPWSSFEEYVGAVVQRELACLRKFRRFPNQQGFYNGPGQYKPSAERKIRILERLEKAIPYLQPKDPVLSSPALWHTDLHSDNIFVDANNPTEITAIIDWQAVHLAPLFLQAQHPTFLEFDGELPQGHNSKSIKLPDNYDTLTDAEKTEAKKTRTSQMLWMLYELQLLTHGNQIQRAIKVSKSLECSLVRYAGIVASDGELQVESLLIQWQESWHRLVENPSQQPCPFHFTEQDKAVHEEEYARFVESVELMGRFLDWMGASRGWEGWISCEQYEWGKERMMLFRDEFFSQLSDQDKLEWEQVWPFQDDAEEGRGYTTVPRRSAGPS